jgi:hypothetical protein
MRKSWQCTDGATCGAARPCALCPSPAARDAPACIRLAHGADISPYLVSVPTPLFARHLLRSIEPLIAIFLDTACGALLSPQMRYRCPSSEHNSLTRAACSPTGGPFSMYLTVTTASEVYDPTLSFHHLGVQSCDPAAVFHPQPRSPIRRRRNSSMCVV